MTDMEDIGKKDGGDSSVFFIVQKLHPSRGLIPGTFRTFGEALRFRKSLELAYPKSRFRVLECRPVYPARRNSKYV